jgi:hypothetical protein
MMVGFSSFSQAVRASYELYRKGVAATMTFAMNRERALWAIPRLVQSTNIRGLLVLAFDGPNKELVSAQKRFATKMLAGKKAKFLDHRMLNEFRKNMFGGIASARTGLFTGQIGAATPSFLDCRSALRWYRDSERICSEYNVSILGAAHLGPRHGFISIAHGTRGSSSEDNLRNIRCRYALIKRAQELGGTAESSHGIGVKNVLFLHDELGPIGVRLMRGLKRVLDPKDILNPGKAWDGSM